MEGQAGWEWNEPEYPKTKYGMRNSNQIIDNQDLEKMQFEYFQVHDHLGWKKMQRVCKSYASSVIPAYLNTARYASTDKMLFYDEEKWTHMHVMMEIKTFSLISWTDSIRAHRDGHVRQRISVASIVEKVRKWGVWSQPIFFGKAALQFDPREVFAHQLGII